MAREEGDGVIEAVAAYLASEGRLAANENDLFRHYPELDR